MILNRRRWNIAPGEFNYIITEPLPLYSVNYTTIASSFANKTRLQTKLQSYKQASFVVQTHATNDNASPAIAVRGSTKFNKDDYKSDRSQTFTWPEIIGRRPYGLYNLCTWRQRRTTDGFLDDENPTETKVASHSTRCGDDTLAVSQALLTSLMSACVWHHHFLPVAFDLCNALPTASQ